MFQINIVEKIKTHILCSITFFNNLAFYEIAWKNILQPDRLQMTIWRMRIVCWMSKAVETLLEYVIVIVFPLQQFMHQRPSLLLYTCIACLVLSLDYLHRKQLTDISTWTLQGHICPGGCHEGIYEVGIRGLSIFYLDTSLLKVANFKRLLFYSRESTPSAP